MANYDSNYTGRQIDDSVNFTESFNRTPAEIESALNTFESIESTPSNIDNAVNYLTLLEGELTPSQIRMMYDYYDGLSVTYQEVNAVVMKFNNVNSQPSQIDNTVDAIVNNNATIGQVLTADGAGGASWGNLPSAQSLYHHTITFSRYDGSNNSRWSCEWIDTLATSSLNATAALFTLSSYYRNANCPKIALGLVFDNGVSVYINGFTFNTSTSTYDLIPDDYPTSTPLSFSNFNGWTFVQNTRTIG